MTNMSTDELVAYIEKAQSDVTNLQKAHRFTNFTPLSFQKPWFLAKNQIRAILCGNQLGKSTAGAIEVLANALGFYPKALGGQTPIQIPVGNKEGFRILAAGETFDVGLRDTILPKLKYYITEDMLSGRPKRGAHSFETEFNFKSGAKLILMSYQQPAAAFEGPQWDLVWFDEPPPRETFNAVRRGCMARDGKILITATPLKEPWMWDDLILPASDPEHPSYGSVAYFQSDMHENCHECHGGYLPHRQIQSFLSTLPSHERAAREQGIFLDLQGLEFHYFNEETHVVEDFDIPPTWPIIEVCDPSMKRGLYNIYATCSPQDKWYVFHAAHIADGAFSTICEDLKKVYKEKLPRSPDLSIMDQRGGKHSLNKLTQTNWFDELRNNGVRFVPSTDVQIQTLHDWLRPKWDQDAEKHIPKLRFFKSVAGMDKGPVWGLKRFVWDPMSSKARQYRQVGKDWTDCVRYLSGHPGLKFHLLTRGWGPQALEKRLSVAANYASKLNGINYPQNSQSRRLPNWGKKRLGRIRVSQGYSPR